MNNKELAAVLKQIAVYQELAGENPFKSRAFERAARIVEQHPESFATLVAEDRMSGIQGIGKGIGDVLRELVASGKSTVLEQLKAGFPAGLEELLTLGGLGPKRVRLLWQKLGISTIGELEYACGENRLLALEGFGEKSQAKILKAIAFKKQYQEMHLYSEAEEIASQLIEQLNSSGLFSGIHVAGSLRRGKRILKDADILLIPLPEADRGQVRRWRACWAPERPRSPFAAAGCRWIFASSSLRASRRHCSTSQGRKSTTPFSAAWPKPWA
jgi:DNA polymerase (family 10)